MGLVPLGCGVVCQSRFVLSGVPRRLLLRSGNRAPPDGLRPVESLVLRPSRDPAALAVGHISLLPRQLQMVVRALGGERETAAAFLSYLLFDRAFASRLMDLGYEDVRGHWPAIEAFFARVERAR